MTGNTLPSSKATGTPLDDLSPKQRLALDLYTNPLYRTFGNKRAAATAAGYEAGYVDRAMVSESMKRAIAYMMELQEEQSQHVATFMARHAMHAAQKLVKQLGADEGLEVHQMPEGLLDKPATPIMGVKADGTEYIAGWDDGHLKQAKAITNHNRSVASLMKEVREAAKLLVAYQLGTPEQKIQVDHNDRRAGLDLSEFSDVELRNLARTINQALKHEGPPPEEGGPIIEAEVLEEDEP